ncbi:MAG: hypothetical protein NVSMB14_18090 [Isosphaeraceae bacterium]
MFGKNTASQQTIETLVGAKASIVGDLRFTGGLRVDGRVTGSLAPDVEAATSYLVVSELATIEGSITASRVIINGTVLGPIEGDFVELQPKARVTGDIRYQTLEMHNGALVEGMLKHQDVKPDLKLLAGGAN